MRPTRLTSVLVLVVLAIGGFAAQPGALAPAAALAGVTTGTDACGVQPTKPDGTAWRCSFVDNFSSGPINRAKWLPQTGFATGSATAQACYIDSPSTISV